MMGSTRRTAATIGQFPFGSAPRLSCPRPSARQEASRASQLPGDSRAPICPPHRAALEGRNTVTGTCASDIRKWAALCWKCTQRVGTRYPIHPLEYRSIVLAIQAMAVSVGTWMFFNWLPMFFYETFGMSLKVTHEDGLQEIRVVGREIELHAGEPSKKLTQRQRGALRCSPPTPPHRRSRLHLARGRSLRSSTSTRSPAALSLPAISLA